MKKRVIALITSFVLVLQSILPTGLTALLPGLFAGAASYTGTDSNCVSSVEVQVQGNEGTGAVDVDINVNVTPANGAITNTVIGKDSTGKDVTVEELRSQVKQIYEQSHGEGSFPNNKDMLTPGAFGELKGIVDSLIGQYGWNDVPEVSTKLRVRKSVSEHAGDKEVSEKTVGDIVIPDNLRNGTIEFFDEKNNAKYEAGEWHIKEDGDYYEIEVKLKKDVLFWEQDPFGFTIETKINNDGEDDIDWNVDVKDGDVEAEIVIDAKRPSKADDYSLKKDVGTSDSPFGMTFTATVTANGDNTLKGGKFSDSSIIKNDWEGYDAATLYSVTVKYEDGTTKEFTKDELNALIDEDGNFIYEFTEESKKAYIILEYSATDDYMKEKYKSINDSKDGQGGSAGSNGYSNIAHFTPSDPDSSPKDDTAYANMGSVQLVDKSGAPSQGDSQKIEWTVTIDADNFNYENPYFLDYFQSENQELEAGATVTVNGQSFTLGTTVKAESVEAMTAAQAKSLLGDQKAVLVETSDGKKGFLLDLTGVKQGEKIVIRYSTDAAQFDEDGNAVADNDGELLTDKITAETPDGKKHENDTIKGITDHEKVTTKTNPIEKTKKGFDPASGLFTWNFTFDDISKKYDYAIIKDTPDGSQIFPEFYTADGNTITLSAISNKTGEASADNNITLAYKGSTVPDKDSITADSQGYYVSEDGKQLTIVLYNVTGEYKYTFQLKTKLSGGDFLDDNYNIDEHYTDQEWDHRTWYPNSGTNYLSGKVHNDVLVETDTGEFFGYAEDSASAARLWKNINNNDYGYVGTADFVTNAKKYNGTFNYEIIVNPYCFDIDVESFNDVLPVGTSLLSVDDVVVHDISYSDNSSIKTYSGDDISSVLNWTTTEGTAAYNGSTKLYSADKINFTFTEENPISKCYIIHLTVKVDDDFASDYLGDSDKPEVQFKNHTTLTGEINGEKFTDTQAANGIVQYDDVTKEGQVDGTANAIKWVVEFNPAGKDMGGMTIVDDLAGTGLRMVMRDDELNNTWDGDQGRAATYFKVEYFGDIPNDWGEGTHQGYIDITDKFKKIVTLGGFQLFIDEDNEYKSTHLRITFYTKINSVADKNNQETFTNKLNLEVTGTKEFEGDYSSKEVSGGSLTYQSWSSGYGLRTLTLKKVNENGEPLDGTVFNINYYNPDLGEWQDILKDTNEYGNDPKGEFTYTDFPWDTLITITETTPHEGYQPNEEPIYLVFISKDFAKKYDGDFEKAKEWFKTQYPDYDDIRFADENGKAEITVKNEPLGKTASVTLNKVWDGFDAAGLSTDEIKAFVEDTLFALKDNDLGDTIKTDTPKWDSGKGTLTFSRLLPGKTYTITETDSSDGYVKFDGTITVEVDDDANVTITVEGEDAVVDDNVCTITNYQLGKIRVDKTFEGKTFAELSAAQRTQLAEGTKFALYTDPECQRENKPATQLTVGEDGFYAEFTDLPYGSYYLKETVAPEGFTKSEDVYLCKVTKTGTTYTLYIDDETAMGPADKTLSIENKAEEIVTGSITADKTFAETVDSAITQSMLDSTEFTLYSDYTDGILSKPVGEPQTLNKDKQAVFANLAPGTYYLAETAAADGYLLDGTIYKCVIGADGKTTYYNINNEKQDAAAFVNEKIKLVINKQYEDWQELKLDLAVLASDTSFLLSRVELDNTLTPLAEAKPVVGTGNEVTVTFETGMPGIEKGSTLILEKDTEYVITEVKAPDRYDSKVNAKGYSFTIDEDGNVTYSAEGKTGVGAMPFVNEYEYRPAAIEFTKEYVEKDFSGMSETEINKWLSGTVFGIYEGSTLLAQTSPVWDGTKAVVTFESRKTYGDNELTLKLGGSYKIVETKTSDGYENATGIAITVEFDSKGNAKYSTVVGTAAPVPAEEPVVIKNTEITVSSDVKLFKQFSDTTLSELTAAQLQELVDSTDFTLYSDEDCKNTVVHGKATADTKNNRVEFVFTHEDIKPGGVYYIKETQDPYYTGADGDKVNFTADSKVIKVTVSADGNTVEYSIDGATADNAVKTVVNDKVVEIKTDIEVIKEYLDSDGNRSDIKALDKSVLEETVFSLVKKGETIPVTVSPDADGKVKFTELSDGEYTLLESDSADGYVKSRAVYTVTVSGGKATFAMTDGTAADSYSNDDKIPVFINKKMPLEIKIIKLYGDTVLDKLPQSTLEKLAADTIFTLYKSAECKDADKVAVTDGLVYEDGKMYVRFDSTDGIAPDSYYWVKETAAPEGYELSDEVVEVYISEDGVAKYGEKQLVETPEITNNKHYVPGNIEIIKDYVGAKDDEIAELAADTIFTLYDKYTDSEKHAVTTAAPNLNEKNEWVVTFTDLELGGVYYVAETKSPELYKLSDKVYVFSISDTGEVSYKLIGEDDSKYASNIPVCQNELKPQPQDITFEKKFEGVDLSKADATTIENLTSAVFTLYKGNAAVTTKSLEVKDGKFIVTFNGLELNTYYKIAETKAPDGYQLLDTVINVYINAEGNVLYAEGDSEDYADTDIVLTNLKKQEQPEPETSKPETSEPETSKPETSEPETSKPETSEPETSKPETSAPETSAPETSAPETSAPETSAPETSAPETSAPETSAPETSAPETSAPETTVPETTKPETTVPETTKPETTVPETTKPETTVPETTDTITAGDHGDNQQDNPITGVVLSGGSVAIGSLIAMAAAFALKKKKK